MNKTNRLLVIFNTLLTTTLVFFGAQMVPSTANAESTTIVACADKSSGALRIAYRSCTTKENNVAWGTTASQSATSLSICKSKTTGAITLRAKCTSKETKISNSKQLTGNVGAAGQNGVSGLSGLQGETGLIGTDGAKGETGDDGSPGLLGAPGLPGAPGRPGVPGLPGNNGDPGIGLTQESIGQKCSLITLTDDVEEKREGVFAWIETSPKSTIYEMVCDTTKSP